MGRNKTCRVINRQMLWDRVGEWWIPEPNTGCWLWLGRIGRKGYGDVFFRGRWEKAHRMAYTVSRCPIPNGLTIDHLCRCRSCINPDHLEAVSNRENIMRGIGPTAANARKTHCSRGHEFTPDNTGIQWGGGRRCRTCDRTYRKQRHADNPDRQRQASLRYRKRMKHG